MNKNDVSTKLVAVFFSAVMIVSAIGKIALEDFATENPDSLLKDNVEKESFKDNSITALKHGTRGSSPRTVLAELFSNWGCGHCPKAGKAMNELMDVYPPSQLVMISFHLNGPSSSDPFYQYNTADNLARKNYYSIGSLPQLYVDGPPIRYIDTKGFEETYIKFKNYIDPEILVLSPMLINLEGNLDQVLLNGTINATIEITDPLPVGNFTIRFAVVEDNLYASGAPNGEYRFRYVMRDMLDEEVLPSLTVGQSFYISKTFPMDPALNWDSISVVVFVQNDDDKDVLQAASYDFIPQDILVVDDDESSHPSGFEDDYHDLLTEMGYAFDGWALNERGCPSNEDLENYEVVIWVIAIIESPTILTTTEQTAISNYLDNGRGSLFIAGENVGRYIGSTTFYQDYLHSNYISDDTDEGNITGVNNDPISDPFFGGTIPIREHKPSEISPRGSATSVFHYSPSGATGGIKAVHDPDSKVVYFAFMYFEGSDSVSNKMILMERILNWMTDFSFMISLSENWNLISIPYIQSNTSFDVVLESIGGDYDCLQIYDTLDFSDSWKHYHNSKPTEMNDISNINHEIAFWVHVNKVGGTVLGCKGTEPTENQTIDLHKGWNLVGYPSLINREIDSALNKIDYGSEVDSVWTYNAASHEWLELGPTDFFELGKGYWIHSLVEETWDVPL